MGFAGKVLVQEGTNRGAAKEKDASLPYGHVCFLNNHQMSRSRARVSPQL